MLFHSLSYTHVTMMRKQPMKNFDNVPNASGSDRAEEGGRRLSREA